MHVSDISFSYERMGVKTRFEKEAKGSGLLVSGLQSVVQNPMKQLTIMAKN